MEKTEETGNVGWTVQCRHSMSKAVQESAHLYNEWQDVLLNSQICLCLCTAYSGQSFNSTIRWQILELPSETQRVQPALS